MRRLARQVEIAAVIVLSIAGVVYAVKGLFAMVWG